MPSFLIKNLHQNHKGFTIFELLLGMTIFALIMTSILLSVENLSIARIKTDNRVVLLEELYFFSENLITAIKEGGVIDYEEYWNRNSYNTQTATGHYLRSTGFGNYGAGGALGTNTFGSKLYYCRSEGITAATRMGTGGCLTGLNTAGNMSGTYQRYGEYGEQFTDYNGNGDADAGIYGDENGDGNIRGDEDDKEIGEGPKVISGTTLSGNIIELYLINNTLKERTFFRYTYKPDPNAPAWVTCDMNTGSGCLGNIQILKLRGLDIGLDHSGSTTDGTAFDGKIDTWICHPDWKCSGAVLPNGYGTLPSGADGEWVDLFSDNVSVRNIRFSVFPERDPWLSWAAPDGNSSATFISPFIHPYVRMQFTLGFSWGKRRALKNEDPTISLATTVSLTNN